MPKYGDQYFNREIYLHRQVAYAIQVRQQVDRIWKT